MLNSVHARIELKQTRLRILSQLMVRAKLVTARYAPGCVIVPDSVIVIRATRLSIFAIVQTISVLGSMNARISERPRTLGFIGMRTETRIVMFALLVIVFHLLFLSSRLNRSSVVARSHTPTLAICIAAHCFFL